MLSVCVLVLEGVLDSSLGISLDILNTADTLSRSKGYSGLKVQAQCVGDNPLLRTSSGLQVVGLRRIEVQDTPDIVLIPGCNINNPDALADWLNSIELGIAQRWLRKIAPRTRLIAGGCMGTFLMASCGLLDGKKATTTWWLAAEFRQRYPKVKLDMRRMVIDEGSVLTAGAALAQADLIMRLVHRLCVPSIAHLVSSYMLVNERTSQSQYVVSSHIAKQHPDVLKAEEWVRANMQRPFGLDELADALHVTPRTLARRFTEAVGTSPYDFVQRIRVEQAYHLLCTTQTSLPQVAEAVGYQDVGTLRRVLKRFDYPSPSEVRLGANKSC